MNLMVRLFCELCITLESANFILITYVFNKDHTRVGADTSQDIQLFGIGIQPEHCVIDITTDGEVYLSPKENAR